MGPVWHIFESLHFQYSEQFLVALTPMTFTVVLHGQAMHWVGRYFRRYGRRAASGTRASSRGVVPIVIVGIMLVAHSVEVGGWAFFYVLTGMLQDAKDAMFFSINAYTTLGASNLTLPGRWQGLGGLEAMTAMLMFGWSTAVLATAMRIEFD